jgi:hypothetical protein
MRVLAVGLMWLRCAGALMRNVVGLFWLLVGLSVWLVLELANGVLAVVDEVCGWINRRFDELYGDW